MEENIVNTNDIQTGGIVSVSKDTEPKVFWTHFIEVNGIKMTVPCDKLLEALSKMQGVLDNAKKESKNPYFNSKYADLATCLQTTKLPMSENGLSMSQHCFYDGANVSCVSVLGHSSGQMMVSTLTVPVTKKDAQGVGAAITYARRYAMSSIVGLSQADDDAESAVEHESDSDTPEHNGVYATDKQVGLINSLLQKGGFNVESVLDRYKVANLESLSKEQASQVITILKKQVGE